MPIVMAFQILQFLLSGNLRASGPSAGSCPISRMRGRGKIRPTLASDRYYQRYNEYNASARPFSPRTAPPHILPTPRPACKEQPECGPDMVVSAYRFTSAIFRPPIRRSTYIDCWHVRIPYYRISALLKSLRVKACKLQR